MAAPSYQLSDEEIQYLSLLLGIIDSQNWQAFRYAIINNPEVFQTFARTLSRSSELNGMTILHACIRFDPPPAIVELLLHLLPESPSCVDCLSRTPLHVAAGTRASVPVIKLLADAFPGACSIQDADGKTPLHLACDNACELFEGDWDAARFEPPSYDVVETLVRTSPLSVPLEDQDGMSALEHAIFSDSPIKVVKLLQYATRMQCKIQEEKSHLTGKRSSCLERSCVGTPEQLLEKEPSAATRISSSDCDYSKTRGVVRRNGNIPDV